MIDKGITLFFLLFSIGYLFLAHYLKFGTMSNPKTGFLPIVAGSFAVAISLWLFIKANLDKVCKKPAVNWTKLCFIIIGLLLYVILLNVIGFLGATFLIMLFLLKLTDTIGWVMPVMVAVGVSVVCYFIFEYYLGIHLS